MPVAPLTVLSKVDFEANAVMPQPPSAMCKTLYSENAIVFSLASKSVKPPPNALCFGSVALCFADIGERQPGLLF